MFEIVAKEEQKKWNCPCAGYSPKELTEEQIKAYKAIQKATGVELFGKDGELEDFNSCPYSFYNASSVIGVDILRASRAREWREKGQMNLVEEAPVNTLIEAVEEINNSYETAKYKIMKDQREKENSEHEKMMRDLRSKFD